MTQERLNNLLVPHVHKDYTDSLDLVATGNDFVKHSKHRLSTFGKFTSLDRVSGGFCMKCVLTLLRACTERSLTNSVC